MNRHVHVALLLALILAGCGRTEAPPIDDQPAGADTASGGSGSAGTPAPPSAVPTLPPAYVFPTHTVIPTLRPRTDLEKLLFQEGDVTYAKLSEEEDFFPEEFTESKPPMLMTAMVTWTRGANRMNDGSAWIGVYESHTVDSAIPFFKESPTLFQRIEIEGVGELAYRDEITSSGIMFPSITFKRCNAVVIVSVPFHYSDINITNESVVIYAQRIDARLQASSLCTQ